MAVFRRPGGPDDIRSLGSEFDSLKSQEAERLQRYADYREENEATRDFDVLRGVGSDYGQAARRGEITPTRHDLKLPMGQALTVKHAYRIAGRLPDVVVDRREESPQERYRSDTIEKIVWGIIRESRGEQEMASAAWDGSQLGSACFSVYFDVKKQMPVFRSLDPTGVLVAKGLDDPHEFRRFYRFWKVPKAAIQAEYGQREFRGKPVEVDRIGADQVTLVECDDGERRIRFVLEDNVGLSEWIHKYLFVPYIVIPNLGPERRVWGWSDYEFVRALVQYLPRLVSREADILKMVSGGAYLDKGTGQNPNRIQDILRKGGIIPSRKDGSLDPVAPPDVPEFAGSHGDRVMTLIKYLGFAPDAAWGDGNAGSGSDRGLQLLPQFELSAMKQINWASGLGRLSSMCLQMIERKQVGTARYRGAVKRGARRYPFNVTLKPDPQDGSAPPKREIRNPAYDPLSIEPEDEFVDVPESPAELFEGDYEVRFVWQNRIDPDDPAYVLSELNKFQQGAQSLRRTLERLGVESPEDEMKLIEQEADRFPWLRQGMIAMLKAQLASAGQGEGGGPDVNPATGLDDGLGMLLGKDGAAMNVDGASAGLNSDVLGSLYGGA